MSSRLTESFKGSRVVVTGGLGFIGSNLAYRLVELGASVHIIDNLLPGGGGNLFNVSRIRDKVQVDISDIRDANRLHHLLQDKDYLFNLAAQTSHMDSMHDPFTDLEINSKAQLLILEVCRKYNPNIKIVYASTRQVYGKPKYLPVDENHPTNPVDVNGINKMAGEWYHLLYNKVYGINSSVLRLTNTYGPRMRIKDARQCFLGIWIRLLIERKPFEVWDGEQLRDFTYIDDAVDAFFMVAASEKANGKVFNLGGDQPIKLKELATLLIEINGGGEYLVKSFPPDRKPIDIGDYYADYRLIRSLCGWEPKITLREGLAKTSSFYKENFSSYI